MKTGIRLRDAFVPIVREYSTSTEKPSPPLVLACGEFRGGYEVKRLRDQVQTLVFFFRRWHCLYWRGSERVSPPNWDNNRRTPFISTRVENEAYYFMKSRFAFPLHIAYIYSSSIPRHTALEIPPTGSYRVSELKWMHSSYAKDSLIPAETRDRRHCTSIVDRQTPC